MSPMSPWFTASQHLRPLSLDHKVDHENDLPTLLSETRRPPVDTHKRQLSQGTDICTQDLIERLDHHEQRLEQIVQQPSSQQVMTRTNTPALLEKLDGHALEVELLLQKGAAMLAGDDAISRHSTCESLTNQGEADNDSHSEDNEFSEADSTTASSSCGDSCSSSPRSFRLTSDDEDAQERALLGKFDMWLAAKELQCLHREMRAVRKQFSGAQIERLAKTVEVLTGAVVEMKRRI